MKIPNPFQANDWDIATFFRLIAVLQLSTWILIGLDAVGLRIPILREAVVLLYLLFVPGILLLRVFRLHQLHHIETVVYTLGLSVASLMLTGLFMNVVYTRFISATPLSLLPFIVTISAVVVGLCLLSYARDRGFQAPTAIDIRMFSSPAPVVLLLLPFVSIFGAYAFNVTGTSVGTVITLLAVAALILVCGFTNYIPKRYYGIAVLAVAVALLLHSALVTNHLWGFDVQNEYDVAHFVQSNGVWGSPPQLNADSLNLNSMLSIVMLAPLLSIATGIDLTWVLKLIFPLLFAVVPLALFRLYEKQTTHRIALFGVFYFMVTFSFYTEMVVMARQEIAELFLVLFLLVLVDKEMERTPRFALFGLFGFSLIASHYALTYIFLFCLILAWLILAFSRRYDVSALRHLGARNATGDRHTRTFRKPKLLRTTSTGISVVLVAGLGLITLLWYRFANNSKSLDILISIFNRTLAYIGIRTPLLSESGVNASNPILEVPKTAGRGLDTTGLQTLLVQQLPMHEVTKYLILAALIVSVLGIFFAYRERQRLRLAPPFVAFSVASVVLLLICLVAPYFASSLNISRFYHITQIELGVFLVIGFVGIFNLVKAPPRTASVNTLSRLPIKALACFTVILLLFNVGLVYVAAGELTNSATVLALDKNVDYSKFNDQETTAAGWLGGHSSGSEIYTDFFRFYAIYIIDRNHARHLPLGGSWATLPPGSYTYLGTPNVQNSKLVLDANSVTSSTVEVDSRYFVGGRSAIYSNGGAQVYLNTA